MSTVGNDMRAVATRSRRHRSSASRSSIAATGGGSCDRNEGDNVLVRRMALTGLEAYYMLSAVEGDMECLADDTIFDFLRGRLSPTQVASFEEHVNQCA